MSKTKVIKIMKDNYLIQDEQKTVDSLCDLFSCKENTLYNLLLTSGLVNDSPNCITCNLKDLLIQDNIEEPGERHYNESAKNALYSSLGINHFPVSSLGSRGEVYSLEHILDMSGHNTACNYLYDLAISAAKHYESTGKLPNYNRIQGIEYVPGFFNFNIDFTLCNNLRNILKVVPNNLIVYNDSKYIITEQYVSGDPYDTCYIHVYLFDNLNIDDYSQHGDVHFGPYFDFTIFPECMKLINEPMNFLSSVFGISDEVLENNYNTYAADLYLSDYRDFYAKGDLKTRLVSEGLIALDNKCFGSYAYGHKFLHDLSIESFDINIRKLADKLSNTIPDTFTACAMLDTIKTYITTGKLPREHCFYTLHDTAETQIVYMITQDLKLPGVLLNTEFKEIIPRCLLGQSTTNDVTYYYVVLLSDKQYRRIQSAKERGLGTIF